MEQDKAPESLLMAEDQQSLLAGDQLQVQHQLQLITDEDERYFNILKRADQIPLFEPNKKACRVDVNSKNTSRMSVVYMDKGKSVTVIREPAFMETDSDEPNYLYYPGLLEASILDGIKKIASYRGFHKMGRMVGVLFRLSDLVNMISTNKVRYSYEQVRRGLQVLRRAPLTVSFGGDTDKPVNMDGTIIKQMVSRSDRSFVGESNELIDQGYYFVQLHDVIMLDIENLDIRQADHHIMQSLGTIPGQMLYKHLCWCYSHANNTNSIKLKVSDHRIMSNLDDQRERGMQMRDARKPTIRAIEDLQERGILERYELSKTIKAPTENRARRTMRVVDEEYRLYATERFIKDQRRANAISRDTSDLFLKSAQEHGYTGEEAWHEIQIPQQQGFDPHSLKEIREQIKQRNFLKLKEIQQET